MAIDLTTLTLTKARAALDSGRYTAVELAEAYLEVIKKKDADVHAYLEVYDDVIVQAQEADAFIAACKKEGKAIPALAGIPIALKDNILLKGKIASAASRMLENYHATYDATVVAKLKEEKVVFIGRTNMDEFAMGGSTENSAFGITKNPHDLTRVPGGSSGGSAAAVAMDGALLSLGTDTGGSVRQPASYCGVVGLKPTYGAVSRHGIIAMGSSLDQVGPLGKTVGDVETIFNVIRGKDAMDGTTISPETYPKKALHGAGGKKPVIGIPRHFLGGDGIDPEVIANFNASLEHFKKLGYEIKDVELPNISYSLAVYYIVMPAEVSSNLARFDGMKYGLHKEGTTLLDDYLKTRGEGFGKEVRRRIILGTYVLSSGYYDAYYNRANAVRELLTKDFERAFESVDIIMTPTAPSPAFMIGEKTSDPVSMYLADIFTVTANLTGMPAMSIPSGFAEKNAKKLPLGIQMTAPLGREDIVFETGKEFLGE